MLFRACSNSTGYHRYFTDTIACVKHLLAFPDNFGCRFKIYWSVKSLCNLLLLSVKRNL